jgi:GNAT superfamily N-acetyltransferase
VAATATIALSDQEDAATEKAVEHGLIAFNDAAAARPRPHDWLQLTLSVRRLGETAVAGGLLGRTQFGWLFVALLYLPDDLRGQGIGAELLRRAEDAARARGCVGAYLDSYSFQARGFYEKHGYAVLGTIPDCPPGHARFFLLKRLTGTAADPTRNEAHPALIRLAGQPTP